jgi:hypothetical protein
MGAPAPTARHAGGTGGCAVELLARRGRRTSVRTVLNAVSTAGRKSLVFFACFAVCVLAVLVCAGFGVLAWTLLRDAIL